MTQNNETQITYHDLNNAAPLISALHTLESAIHSRQAQVITPDQAQALVAYIHQHGAGGRWIAIRLTQPENGQTNNA